MTATTVTRQLPPPLQRRPAHRSLLRRFRPSRLAINIVLAAIALFWLVPSFSMLIISFHDSSLYEISGWWKVFTNPSQLTLENYKELFTGGTSSTLGAAYHPALRREVF